MSIEDRKEVEALVKWGLLLDKTAEIIRSLGEIQIGVKEITIKLKGVQLGKESK